MHKLHTYKGDYDREFRQFDDKKEAMLQRLHDSESKTWAILLSMK